MALNTQPSWLNNMQFCSLIRTSATQHTDNRFIMRSIVSGSVFWLASIYIFKNSHVFLCGLVSSCLITCSLTSCAYLFLRMCKCVFVYVLVLASPVCLCLCVLLLKDLHSGVLHPSVKSYLVPVCHLTKTRHTHGLCASMLYCMHYNSTIYLQASFYRWK